MESNIKNFYNGKSLFVTGATGFLGKTLIEKLLRSCDGIQTIYILIRQKRSKTAQQRSQEYCSDPVFSFNGLNETFTKIEPIFGDILLPDLGISSEDRQRLITSVDIVIHLAAIVKLNAPLKTSIQRNLKPIKAIIELCHQMERLDCLVYASTIALLNGTDNKAEVVPKEYTVSPEFVIKTSDILKSSDLNQMTKFLFYEYQNTYCISKALSEQLLLRECSRLKIAIIRPSAILPAYKEPIAGWVNGLQIINTGLLIGLGVMQVLPPMVGGAQCFIPVDYVANSVIASAWFVSGQKTPNLQVYNLTTTIESGITIKQLLTNLKNNSKLWPSKRVIRCPQLRIASTDFHFKVYNFYKHFVFAYLIDLIAKLIGRETKLIKTIHRMNENFKDIQSFINSSPEYEVKNTFALIENMSETDRKEFGFDVRDIEWNIYCRQLWLGIRRFLLREKDSNMTFAKIKYERLVRLTFMINMIFTIFLTILLLVFYNIIF